ncbi:MAG: zinc-dependent metalloprotease [Chitinophagales bacterium]
MKFNNVLVVLAMTMVANAVVAQDTTAVTKTVPNKLRPYSEVITTKAVTKPGLFSVHKVDEKYYFEIPDQLLSREFLFTTRLSKVATGSPLFGGELLNGMIVSFEKAPNDKLFVRAVTSVAVSDTADAISLAVKNATVDPIIMVLDLKARGKDNKSSVIDFTDFYLKENLISGFSTEAKKVMRTGTPAADRSFILSMNAFPQNIEIKSLKTYSMGGAPAKGSEGGATEPAPASANVGVTFEISNSVSVLPETAMQTQVFDPRVGFSADGYQVFSDAQQRVEEKRFIIRNRLEVKPEDLQRYKAGELVEPKEPLLYYVDPATPKQWRKYIIAGINDWNEAFKAAGFKNAIIGKEWPENDSAMSLEDARYRVVRYYPSVMPFSYGPKLHDPRTGEILQSYIGWSHSQIKTLHDWYMVQAGAADPEGRTMKFNDELMGALIRADISRTVGFTLGLKENLGSSSTIPVEKLRDKNWLATHPFNHSIMDYNHYNYVAQPADGVSRNGLIPQIGEYDKWAIKWAYTYTGAKDFETDKKIRLKWITDNVKPGSKLIYMTDQSILPNDPLNPAAQWEDLSSEPVKASEYGVKNLKIAMANLLTWTKVENSTYYPTSDLYYTLCDQFSFLIRHVYSQIGGVREDATKIGLEEDVYAPVPKATQKAAVAFLNKEVFNTPAWLFDPNVMNKWSRPGKKENYQRFQDNAMMYVIHESRLLRMHAATMRFGKEKTYTVDEFMTDLNKGLFAELPTRQTVDSYKRFMQKQAVGYMLQIAQTGDKLPDGKSDNLTTTDVPVVMRSHLRNILAQCKAATPSYTDPVMVAHLKYLSQKIDNYLNPKN